MPPQDRLRAAFEEMARLRKEFPGLVSAARPRWVARPVEWLLDVAILLVVLTPWATVLLGTALPAWLVDLLRLGPPS